MKSKATPITDTIAPTIERNDTLSLYTNADIGNTNNGTVDNNVDAMPIFV